MAEEVGQEVLARVDLLVRQGSDCAFTLLFSEEDEQGTIVQDFTGWSARSQLRRKVGGEIWHELAVGAGLTLTHDAGVLTVAGLIPHAVTEDPAWNARNVGAWDIELVRADGWVIPLAAGAVRVDHDVTREAA
ncbi:hypothetical protein [Cellulomonas taurus]|uniref:hypothetical protein n=1 Tax=Cellulomonas taurus TaxID=2729175 RepID=UPI00197F4BC6|nr:hypothetical protein [Cellulomonas taurus]